MDTIWLELKQKLTTKLHLNNQLIMNFLSQYYNQTENGDGQNRLSVSDDQGSAFAKQVAGDFNPIHDKGSKRFCVPGDLLFALALNEYGLHQKMEFKFLDLVNADAPLFYPTLDEGFSGGDVSNPSSRLVIGERDRPMLEVNYAGQRSTKASQIESMVKRYVAFSGQNFPDILVPLMQQHNVMINPKRPLVIYQSMSFEFERLDFDMVDIALGETSLDVDGKRGRTQLHFSLKSGDEIIGHGSKHLVMSGMREYDEETVRQMCDDYLAGKNA